MALDLVAVLKRLGVNLDFDSAPNAHPGVISWLGRLYDVSPEHFHMGMSEGMGVWTSGQGFAPLDLAGIETWLFDAPSGDHLIIAERKITFDLKDTPQRNERSLTIWTQNDLAAFIGHSVLDGSLVIIDEEELVTNETEPEMFAGTGPFTLKPRNDFTQLDSEGLDVSMAKPVLIPGKVHNVRGLLKGPAEDEISRWVLNCGGLYILHDVELLERSPLLNQESLEINSEPDFSEILSERRAHSDGMGDLLRWWRFENEGATIETYDVLVPAHISHDASGSKWILDGVTGTLHRNL
jgi:hypothetical protein